MAKKALFVVGGYPPHTPFESAELFAGLLREADYETEISDTLDAYLRDDLGDHDLIVPTWTMDTLTGEQEAGLLNAVESGVGVAGWHGTMGDSFRNATRYQFMVGGQFVAHPGDILDYTVNVTNHEHVITEGLADFNLRSEQYYMHVDPSNDVLATTSIVGTGSPWVAGVTMPVTWTRMWGAGRVAYCTVGHTVNDFDVPEAREMVRRCLLWASR